jgi:hypothetical protein
VWWTFRLQLLLGLRSMRRRQKIASQLVELRKNYENHPRRQRQARVELRLRRFVSDRFSIIQQHFVTGWGGLRPPAVFVSASAPAVQTASLSSKRTRRARR